jgi:hypothetical protein
MPEITEAMMLAADRAWRRELGNLYCNDHEGRAAAIRAIIQAAMEEATRHPPVFIVPADVTIL